MIAFAYALAVLEVVAIVALSADIGTLAHPIGDESEWRDPNVVKVVCDAQGQALYFSRSPIPHRRGAPPEATRPADLALRHIGLYAYRVAALRRFAVLPPGRLETCEALEQLRALEHGLRIRVGVTPVARYQPRQSADARGFEVLFIRQRQLRNRARVRLRIAFALTRRGGNGVNMTGLDLDLITPAFDLNRAAMREVVRFVFRTQIG